MGFNGAIKDFFLVLLALLAVDSHQKVVLHKAFAQAFNGANTNLVGLLNLFIGHPLGLIFIGCQQDIGSFNDLTLGITLRDDSLELFSFGLGEGDAVFFHRGRKQLCKDTRHTP